jgi:YD repeat-containing protein
LEQWNTSERYYDLAGRPVAISLGFDAQSQLLALRNYSYDAAGKITGIVDGIDSTLDQTYGYDNLDRLISNQQGAFTLTSLGYSYDLNSNRTSKTINNSAAETSNIDPGSNRLQLVLHHFSLNQWNNQRYTMNAC